MFAPVQVIGCAIEVHRELALGLLSCPISSAFVPSFVVKQLCASTGVLVPETPSLL